MSKLTVVVCALTPPAVSNGDTGPQLRGEPWLHPRRVAPRVATSDNPSPTTDGFSSDDNRLRDVEMHHPPPLVGQDHEDKEHLERDGRHNKEVHGNQVLDVIVQKGLPCRRGRLPWAHAVLFH